MAQVSIQYSLDQKLDNHDVKQIKKMLDKLHGVNSVRVSMPNALVCVDYDDTSVTEKQLEEVLSFLDCAMTMVDKITF